jgi:HK97 family phage portal protein
MTILNRGVVLFQKALRSLVGVSGSRGWWPLIRELTTGGWQRNEDVHLDTVLSNPTLYACVTLIAGDIAKLRPMLVEQDKNQIWTEIENSAHSPVLRQPNAYQAWVDFCEWWMLSKIVHGNTYALKARDGRGVVRALYILDPNRVTPLVAPDGSVFYQLHQDELAQLGDDIIVPAREIIHDIMCPLFHPLVGVSPIYAAGWPAMQGLNIRRTSDKFFSNGSRPGGVLLVPGDISPQQAIDLKTQWDTAFSGDNAGKIAVLSGQMKYEPMAMTAEQSRLVEQLHMSDEDIAKCFHMPRHKVGIGPDPTYTNIGALNQQYYTDCLQKHITKLQRKLTDGLELGNVPSRTLAVELDLDDLILMDTASRITAAGDAMKSGMSVNETRFRFHDLGPVEGGDVPFLQEQNWPVRLLAARELLERQPTPPAQMPADLEPDEADVPEEKTWTPADFTVAFQKAIAV